MKESTGHLKCAGTGGLEDPRRLTSGMRRGKCICGAAALAKTMLRKGRMKNGLNHSYQWLFLYVGGVLRKGKRKQASQDRNGYLSLVGGGGGQRGGWLLVKGPDSPERSQRPSRMCGRLKWTNWT